MSLGFIVENFFKKLHSNHVLHPMRGGTWQERGSVVLYIAYINTIGTQLNANLLIWLIGVG